jgi:hypothetical protein
MTKRIIAVIVMMLLLSAGLLVSCGGGGGGDSAPPLTTPAFTNLAGTRWNQVDTVSTGNNSCEVSQGTTDQFTLAVLSQSGNTITVYDSGRSSAADAVSGTMSGYVVTFKGSRYPVYGCSNMSASYSLTMNAAGTAYSGTGTITCNDAPACSVPVTVTGTKI